MASTTAQHAEREQPVGSVRFDWAMVALSGGLEGGAHLDAWANEHGRVDNSFFTPWHGVLYSALLLVGVFLAGAFLRNIVRGYTWRRALPIGYGLSLLGVLVFAAGGIGDIIWHSLFGIENDLEALLSPTHLMLAFGWVLIVGGPLRAAWQHTDQAPTTRAAAHYPKVFALTFILSVFTFFTVYANPFAHVLAVGGQPEVQGEFGKALGVAGFLLQPALLMGLLLLALRRWTLPFGSLTLVIALNTALLSVMHDQYLMIPVAALAGLLADGLLQFLQPSVERPAALRIFALVVPAILYTLYFLTLMLTVGIAWSTHLWVGAIVLAGIVGLLLSYLVLPPYQSAVRRAM
ncbi:hypothetical protein SE17_03905 [Kouleothrix aurantiaca]|uniref:Uncharacterized protein n=1 Tax=Kouleothrix aurantiaca TaxID=186479 RepID=A0A0N8PT34_9CHLR|nr:hypothetical protein SE17_03905 [Kouleothrix aurantiaca]